MEYPKCLYCDQNATKLYYYSKTYQSGRDTLESPILSCEECTLKARQDLSICRGGTEGICCRTFKQIAQMTEKQISCFCSKRWKEVNHLANKPMRQLIFRIHYLNLPSKKESNQNHVSP